MRRAPQLDGISRLALALLLLTAYTAHRAEASSVVPITYLCTTLYARSIEAWTPVSLDLIRIEVKMRKE